MSDLRKAAEMALEFVSWFASDDHSVRPKHKAPEIAETLRQALAQPEWVGLTQEEVDALLWKLSVGAVDEDVRTIEAKLKEKNT